MTTPSTPRLPKIATLDSVWSSVAEFAARRGASPSQTDRFGPLDAYLIHLFLEFGPGPALVIDLAWATTGAGSSVVCLANDRTCRLLVEPSDQAELPGLLTNYALDAALAAARTLQPISQVDEALAVARRRPHEKPLILVDAQRSPLAADGPLAILQDAPETLILVLGAGRLDTCPAANQLVAACLDSAEARFWRLSEVSASLHGAQTVLLAHRDNSHAPALVRQIEDLFTTNFDYLDALHKACMYTVNRAIAERLEREVEQLKHTVKRLETPLILQTYRRVTGFARRHRKLLAPPGSTREAAALRLVAARRQLRKTAA